MLRPNEVLFFVKLLIERGSCFIYPYRWANDVRRGNLIVSILVCVFTIYVKDSWEVCWSAFRQVSRDYSATSFVRHLADIMALCYANSGFLLVDACIRDLWILSSTLRRDLKSCTEVEVTHVFRKNSTTAPVHVQHLDEF